MTHGRQTMTKVEFWIVSAVFDSLYPIHARNMLRYTLNYN